MMLKNLIISLAVLLDPLFFKINVLKLSCVILKYFNDMKIEEISDILDLPINTIKIQLKRARESLSNILKEDYLSE
jgi:RNA polymerase sigma-70 factor (ECF subfamily)